MSSRRERANRWWLRCQNCGVWKPRPGHFIPPSFGDPGFFICEKREATR